MLKSPTLVLITQMISPMNRPMSLYSDPGIEANSFDVLFPHYLPNGVYLFLFARPKIAKYYPLNTRRMI